MMICKDGKYYLEFANGFGRDFFDRKIYAYMSKELERLKRETTPEHPFTLVNWVDWNDPEGFENYHETLEGRYEDSKFGWTNLENAKLVHKEILNNRGEQICIELPEIEELEVMSFKDYKILMLKKEIDFREKEIEYLRAEIKELENE